MRDEEGHRGCRRYVRLHPPIGPLRDRRGKVKRPVSLGDAGNRLPGGDQAERDPGGRQAAEDPSRQRRIDGEGVKPAVLQRLGRFRVIELLMRTEIVRRHPMGP
jgi:hypothetical protein